MSLQQDGRVSGRVAWLDYVSLGQIKQGESDSMFILIRITQVRASGEMEKSMPRPYLGDQSQRYIYLPPWDEMQLLMENFFAHINFISNIIHRGSLLALLNGIYNRGYELSWDKLGHLVLVLSIIASSTYTMIGHDTETEKPFSSAEVSAQTPFWVNQTLSGIDDARNGDHLSLELVQGIMTISFILCKLEGVSRRYKSLISTPVLLSHELGLHVSDLTGNHPPNDTIEAEMRRRVWWHIVTTDWLIASRYNDSTVKTYHCNPAQMAVRKPMNIDDGDDTIDGKVPKEQDILAPTNMSLFLQKLKLAEILRALIDRNPLVSMAINDSNYSDVLDIDSKLKRMREELPQFFRVNLDDLLLKCESEDPRSSKIAIQSYVLESLILSQRCKLHLPYFFDTTQASKFEYSRLMCLEQQNRSFAWNVCCRKVVTLWYKLDINTQLRHTEFF